MFLLSPYLSITRFHAMLRATEQSKDYKLSIFSTYSLISIVSTVSWYTG